MNTQITKVEVKAFTKEEAKNSSEVPFQVLKDATAAWKNAGCPPENLIGIHLSLYKACLSTN